MGQELAKRQSGSLESRQQIELRSARLLAALSMMEEESRQEMEPGQKARWAKWLKSYRIETIEAAAERWIKGNKFLPKFEELETEIRAIMAEEAEKKRKQPNPNCSDCGGSGMKPKRPRTTTDPFPPVTSCDCLETPPDFKERQAGE